MSDTVLLDAGFAYPEVKVVLAAMRGRDWAAVRAVLDAAGPVGRSTLIRAASEEYGQEEFLRHVLAEDPDDTAAAAMLGMHLIDIGWRIRSDARAQHVSGGQFEAFHDWLRRAEMVLLEGVARGPADPALWVARLTSARGLELGLDETRRRYRKLAAIDPHHLPGQNAYLQRLCPKWSGDWPMLHAWCRAEMLAAPPGAVQAVLVVDGHIEHWAELGESANLGYLRSKPVRDEIDEAAQRSVRHPDFGRDYGWVQVASSFAMIYSVLGDRAAAGAMFDMLGDLGTEVPWCYVGDGNAAQQIRAYRQRARRRGRVVG
ncbi:hypothetical protein GCM10010172_13830 [Paractinoplanes ferrugineus]|uniref:DUF4034 domain-containing protein n=1 Tax=Paractinoplanes ferrugineus TaxID=113564 RepID=A0A919MBP9_9ACTN|nr:hypothetical protein [Actinoplanes ferrugineus]GIE09948.1 hypothetical protein Afe05nite_17880 [Actinoplanes ferrugineus]